MMIPGQARKAAERFLLARAREAGFVIGSADPFADELIDACALHLVAMGLSAGDAADLSFAVWAEIESEPTGCSIDVSRSTPYLLHLNDPVSNQTWPITVADLVRMIGPRGLPARQASGG